MFTFQILNDKIHNYVVFWHNSPSPNRISPHYESKENICLSRTTSLVIFVEVTGTTRTKDISIAYKNRSSLYITRFLGWKGLSKNNATISNRVRIISISNYKMHKVYCGKKILTRFFYRIFYSKCNISC